MADDPNQYWMGQEVPRLQAALGAARQDLERERFFARLRQEDLKAHRETIEQQRGFITRQVETISRQHETIQGLRETIARQQEKPDRQLVRENDDLARGILKLERDLKLAQEAQKRADGALQTAHNLAEMWRGRYERALAATAEEALLPLAYFPAGEDPDARWAVTDLGERALRAGVVKGPKWVLLVSPDPREVLSVEVRPTPSYDLAAVCARCGAPYREHIEHRGAFTGAMCDGFLAVAEEPAGLHFVCVACHEKLPLSERGPSTMPLCGSCWRKEP